MNATFASLPIFLRRRLRALAAFVIAGVAMILECAAQTPADAVGGGWLNGGAVGEYFANADLGGQPSFTRRDVRVDFDWGTLRGPGGSNAPALAAVGADGFSVRWTGRVQGRFAESYTFTVTCDEGARLFIKPAAGSVWTQLIDQWSTPGTHTGSFALDPQQSYDVVLEYRELTGAALCRLRWSSPSTPLETVDAVTLAALNTYSYERQLWADALADGRDEWGPVDYLPGTVPARDGNGWPLGDGTNIVWEGQTPSERRGMHLLQFRGRAAVRCPGTNVQFSTGATNHGQTLPFEAGYDALTNRTTALVNVVDGTALLYLTFTNTRRLPADASATGVTEIRHSRQRDAGRARHRRSCAAEGRGAALCGAPVDPEFRHRADVEPAPAIGLLDASRHFGTPGVGAHGDAVQRVRPRPLPLPAGARGQ